LSPRAGAACAALPAAKNRGGQSHRLAKLPAVYLPALKASDEISDETFHAVILP